MTFSLNTFLFLGVEKAPNPQVYRRVLFSNVIYLTLAVVYFIFMLIDLESFLRPWNQLNFDDLTVPLVIVYCFIGLYLNKLGVSFFGRISFLIIWLLLMQVIPIVLLQTPADYYLAFPLGIIFHSVLIQLIISAKKEKVSFFAFLTISLFLIIYCRPFLLHFDIDPNRINESIVGSKYYALVGILYWLLFNAMTFYVIKVLDDLITKNEEQRLQLTEKNAELNNMNTLVDEVNKGLESRIERRTTELKSANEVLSSYAFYNAHLIKGPFCRIKGLIMLDDKNAISEEDFRSKLGLSINELDDAIAKMQEHLNDAHKTG